MDLELLFPYVIYFITALVLALCILTIVRAVFAPREAPRGAACGACGYPITELAPPRCPECGALLLKAGITTRAMLLRHRGSLPAALIAWTLLVATIATWGGIKVVESIPIQQASGRVQLIKDQSYESLGPERSSRRTIRFDFDVVLSSAGDIDSGTIEIALQAPGQPRSVAILDRNMMTCRVSDATGRRVWTGPDFEHEAAVALYSAAGLDPADLQCAREIDALYLLAHTALDDPQHFHTTFANSRLSDGSFHSTVFRMASGMSTSSPIAEESTLPTSAIALMVSVPVIYVTGCIALVVLRRRIVAQLFAGSRPSAYATATAIEPS